MRGRGRDEAETRAEAETRGAETCRADTFRAEACRAETRPEEQSTAKSSADRRKLNKGAKTKTGRVACNEREMREPEFAGEARSFLGSAQHNKVRVVIVATRTQRKAHI